MPPKRPATSPSVSPSVAKKTRKCLTLEAKLDIVHRHERGEKTNSIARHHGIAPSSVSTIFKSADSIKKAGETVSSLQVKRTTRTRAHAMDEMETLLEMWISDQVRRRIPVSTSLITAKALSLWEHIQTKLPEEERPKTPFGASKGWFDRFRKRAGLHNITSGKDRKCSFEFVKEEPTDRKSSFSQSLCPSQQPSSMDVVRVAATASHLTMNPSNDPLKVKVEEEEEEEQEAGEATQNMEIKEEPIDEQNTTTFLPSSSHQACSSGRKANSNSQLMMDPKEELLSMKDIRPKEEPLNLEEEEVVASSIKMEIKDEPIDEEMSPLPSASHQTSGSVRAKEYTEEKKEALPTGGGLPKPEEGHASMTMLRILSTISKELESGGNVWDSDALDCTSNSAIDESQLADESIILMDPGTTNELPLATPSTSQPRTHTPPSVLEETPKLYSRKRKYARPTHSIQEASMQELISFKQKEHEMDMKLKEMDLLLKKSQLRLAEKEEKIKDAQLKLTDKDVMVKDLYFKLKEIELKIKEKEYLIKIPRKLE